jgi:hypothetical protein
MNRIFDKGDKVKFNESAVEEVRGKTGIINKFLEVSHIDLATIVKGKSVKYGRYKDVNTWEVRLDDSNKLYPSPEDWLEKIT